MRYMVTQVVNAGLTNVDAAWHASCLSLPAGLKRLGVSFQCMSLAGHRARGYVRRALPAAGLVPAGSALDLVGDGVTILFFCVGRVAAHLVEDGQKRQFDD